MKIRSIISKHPKKFLVFSVLALLVLFLLFPYSNFFLGPPEEEKKDQRGQVAVVDQFPEKGNFTADVLELFDEEGVGVDVYENITVDLYRRLPDMDYGVIIFRIHSSTSVHSEDYSFVSALYTNEDYRSSKYPVLQSKKLLVPASAENWNNGEPVFAITPKFIEKETEGRFNNTLIIFDSCHTYAPGSDYKLPRTFYKKGAGSVIGWKGGVSLEYGDKVTRRFLEHILENNRTFLEAAEEMAKNIGLGTYEHELMIPQKSSNLTLIKQNNELILKKK